MQLQTDRTQVELGGQGEAINITDRVASSVARNFIRNGVAFVFVVGSTAAITTTEFELGLAHHDLQAAFERLAPEDGVYAHEKLWGDDNAHARVRTSLVGPGLSPDRGGHTFARDLATDRLVRL